jgi:hypothetical protein
MNREEITHIDQLTRRVSDLVQQKRKLEVEIDTLKARLKSMETNTVNVSTALIGSAIPSPHGSSFGFIYREIN